eukprot:PITA_32260
MEPKHDHWIAAKQTLRYLCGTINHCLMYTRNEIQLTGYTDSDWGGSETDERNITGGCFSLGSSMVSRMSRNQDTVSLSSAKVEYVVASESCIRFTEDPMFHAKMKDINNKYHYIRSLVQERVMELRYLPIDEQVADILTKALPNKKLEYMRSKLGLVDISSLVERE